MLDHIVAMGETAKQLKETIQLGLINLAVRVPSGGLWGAIPELLFEKKALIPALQQSSFTSYLLEKEIATQSCSQKNEIGNRFGQRRIGIVTEQSSQKPPKG